MGFGRTCVVAVFLSFACAIASPGAAADPEFPTATPEEVGVDSRALVRLSTWIREQRLDVRALLVVKDGQLVFERYSQGVTREHNHALYSVTKSVTSTLIGMLTDDRKIGGPSAQIHRILMSGPNAQRLEPVLRDKPLMTVGNVLAMSSGLRYAHDPERNPIYAAGDRLVTALNIPVVSQPGTQFQYSDGDATIAGALVVAASGRSLELFAWERLFGPLRMRNVTWPGVDQRELHPGGWALRMRAVDMAKFGQFTLDGGVWRGERLVSADWMKLATTRKVGPSYGYFWWTANYGEAGASAEGFKGQRIITLTRRRLVIVIAAVLPRGRENALVRRMVHEFIVPATEPEAAVTPSAALQEALAAELALALTTKGDPRNNLEAQDTPRR